MSGYQDLGETVILLLTAVTVRLLFQCIVCFLAVDFVAGHDMMLVVGK